MHLKKVKNQVIMISANKYDSVPLTHNGCRKMSVVYELIVKNEMFTSTFGFAS